MREPSVIMLSNTSINFKHSKLAYDSYSTVFVADVVNGAVHTWLVSGQYDRCLVSLKANRLTYSLSLSSLAILVDKQGDHLLMYLGHNCSVVSVYTLTYQ